MARDVEQLVVQMSADMRRMERQLQKATRAADQSARKIERRFEGMNKRLVPIFKQTGASLAAGLGIGGALSAGALGTTVRGMIRDLADLRAEAQKAGLAPEAFQELNYAAQQSRVSVDAVTDGVKELQLRADEFIVTGKGPAAEAFARLGLSPNELKTRLQDPADLLNEITNRLRTLDQAAQIRIADEIFGGTGGEQFVRFIDEGVDGIARMRVEAREVGAVLNNDVLNKAAELDAKFGAIATTVDTQLKGAVVEAAAELDKWIAAYGGFAALAQDVARVLSFMRGGPVGALVEALGFREPAGGTQTGPAFEYGGRGSPSAPPAREATFTPLPPSGAGGGSSRSSSRERQNEYQREIDLITRRTEALRSEATTIGTTALEIEKSRAAFELENAAKAAGLTIDDKLRAEIEALATSYAHATIAVDELTEAQRLAQYAVENFKHEASDVLGGFISDIRNGTSAADAFGNALDRIADKLLDMAINNIAEKAFGGGGFLGSLIGSIAGGGASPVRGGLFAKGGVSNRPAVFGEAGPEAAVPLPDGRRIPVDLRLPGIPATNQSGGIRVIFAPQIDATGADPAGLRRVEAQLQAMQSGFPRLVAAAVKDGQGRRRLR